jgi:hypothetical protein
VQGIQILQKNNVPVCRQVLSEKQGNQWLIISLKTLLLSAVNLFEFMMAKINTKKQIPHPFEVVQEAEVGQHHPTD